MRGSRRCRLLVNGRFSRNFIMESQVDVTETEIERHKKTETLLQWQAKLPYSLSVYFDLQQPSAIALESGT